MQQLNQHFVEKILDRIKEKLNAVNDNDLALLFSVKTGTISAWRIRNTIDFLKLSGICQEKGWSLDDLVLGKSTYNSSKSTICSEIDIGDKKYEEIIPLLLKEKDKTIDSLNKLIDTQADYIESLKAQCSQKSGEQKRKAG